MRLGAISQQPVERLSYSIDYSDAITANDEIVDAAVDSIPTDPLLTLDNIIVVDNTVRFYVSGGVERQRYKLEITATSAEGRIYQDELLLTVRDI